MKKVCLSLVFGLSASIATAQYDQKFALSADLIPTIPKPNTEFSVKAVGQTLWNDDFSVPENWVIDNAGNTGTQFGWNINSVSQGWWSTSGISASGTSGGNNAELVNGDPSVNPSTQALNVIYTMTTAQPINIAALGGTNKVNLEFKQFGARYNDLQEIQISLDGTTFVTVGNNNDYSVLSSTGGSAYPNPDTKRINLSSVLTNTSSVWIRFRWTTAFPASASNPNVWVAYGWYIDDVKITEFADNDIQLTSSYWGTEGLNYTQIPLMQVQPIDFTAKVFNGGKNDAKNVKLNVNINSGAFIGSSTPKDIASLAPDSLIAIPFTPTITGSYSITRTITSDSIDDIPLNNTLPNLSFSVTNNIYARDSYTSGTAGTTNGSNGF